jgi:fructokinase
MYAATAQIRMDLKRHVLAVKKAGGLLVYDPNIRQKHHLDNSDTVEAVMENLKWATVIKASDEDCAQIFGVNDQETYLDKLTEINPKALIFLTLGAKGAMCRLQNKTVSMEAIKTEVVSTIGAGDAFNAGLIAELIKQKITTKDITTLSEKNLLKLLQSGIKIATAVCATYDNYISRSL